MENLLFCLNITGPIFLLMVIGICLKRIGWIEESFAAQMNGFVFRLPLPLLVFHDLATVDFFEVWDLKFVAFCFSVTVLSIFIAIGLSFLLKDKSVQGEFIQVSYRSSAALLGIAIIQSIYGRAEMASLMIVASVPLYNMMAVIVLAVYKGERGGIDKQMMRKTAKEIAGNPIIWGIVMGICWSVLRIPMPQVLEKTVANISSIAAPLGLIAMGASFDIRKAFAQIKPSVFAAFLKLIGFAAIFLPLAIKMGFKEQKLIAILVMLGSATTVSCFVMAKNMKHEGVLTSSVVMLTTIFSAFTLTGWLFALKTVGLI